MNIDRTQSHAYPTESDYTTGPESTPPDPQGTPSPTNPGTTGVRQAPPADQDRVFHYSPGQVPEVDPEVAKSDGAIVVEMPPPEGNTGPSGYFEVPPPTPAPIQLSSPPPPPSSDPPPSTGLPPAGTGATDGSTSDAQFDAEYQNALSELSRYFDLLDTAAGIGTKDGVVAKVDLQAAVTNPDLPDDLKKACQFLLDNPAVYNEINAAGGASDDGFITKADVDAAIQNLPSSLTNGWVGNQPPVDPTPWDGTQTDGANAIPLDNNPPLPDPNGGFETGGAYTGGPYAGGSNGPGAYTPYGNEAIDTKQLFSSGMSMEDVVQFVLGRSLGAIDTQIQGLVGELNQAEQAEAAAQKGGSSAKAQAAQNDVQMLQMQLQDLVQKREQMFQLMSNMSETFNETAKSILANLGRA